MPRITEARQPAEPNSAEQRDRHQRILRAASKLGAEHGLERMQMNDVAKEAGVAIATLYRYFPSKTDLFVGVLHSQIRRLGGTAVVGAAADGSRAAAVAEVLIAAGRKMLERSQLATAMLQANNMAQLQGGREYTEANSAFHHVLLNALGVDEPGKEDYRMVRIIEQTWYGILVSVLNGVVTQDEADEDIRLASRLLLGPSYDDGGEVARLP
ncbi:TetR family transcriptional regulator [Nocardioides marmotae]|uniref:TetR family transcriptional regulator n=1 Tax=Nocardioides marmotae TaxID=2663857 RepID=A0A6I3IWU6_9ACTN|nr:TetR family transcriptional regulator [Nocardioides marmotae]MCR6031215.1 TetR family transcriptional regulator [Gordonia jinghuaiqii]MBC9731931.1 TetR/AcrR family transcriptional regulator [Nocardioides marmotae]MTB83051.1 TetR family transcriptional regulator [Nocardioides marmotae]MTB94853.1 TetR family transcriptional regulator [Nocardioides marmotae]QKE01164.1 TetR/AcrR family transcriptional regulator [Nocardioides marmotae]